MITDKEMEQRLHVVFNGTLVDCARIRAVVETEYLTGIPYPKESFIIILVRDAILHAHVCLSALYVCSRLPKFAPRISFSRREDVPVALPQHFSGEPIPILNYVTKKFYVPLVVSICQEVPVKEHSSDHEHQWSDEDSGVESELFQHSPPTMSEFLDGCENTETPEEDEGESKEDVLSPQSEAYFLAYSSSATPPTVCHIPVLCMADEEQLPVLMSSLLYQRRVWHINDPLLGLEFSKYETTIRLFVGWLEDNQSSGHVLVSDCHRFDISRLIADVLVFSHAFTSGK